MSYAVEIAESAERDITEISDVVAFAYGDPVGAARIAGRILDEIGTLSEMPARYPISRNPAIAPLGCRQFSVGNFNIVYRIDETSKTVHVVAVSYFRRLTDFVASRITPISPKP